MGSNYSYVDYSFSAAYNAYNGIMDIFLKSTNLNSLGMLLIIIAMCFGIYLYQKCHVIILTKDTLKYRGLGSFFRWLKINLNDVENEEIDIGYGPELKRTGIVARWYLLDKNNKELGVINFKAFADKDIAKVFQYIHNKKNKTEEESIEKPDNDLQEEIKESTWDFYKGLLKAPLYMLILLAIASIYRLLVSRSLKTDFW